MALNEIIQILPNSPAWVKITEHLKEKRPLYWELWKKKSGTNSVGVQFASLDFKVVSIIMAWKFPFWE